MNLEHTENAERFFLEAVDGIYAHQPRILLL
jgi:hypothetical protein